MRFTQYASIYFIWAFLILAAVSIPLTFKDAKNPELNNPQPPRKRLLENSVTVLSKGAGDTGFAVHSKRDDAEPKTDSKPADAREKADSGSFTGVMQKIVDKLTELSKAVVDKIKDLTKS